MWKRIKEWLFRKEEKVALKPIVKGLGILKGSRKYTSITELEPRLQDRFKRIKNAVFRCKNCHKTVARLKTELRGKLFANSGLKNKHFQLVKNQHNKKKVLPFKINTSNCHHCGLYGLACEVEWENRQ